MVDERTLDAARNIFQGGELGLNLIAHLQRKRREVELVTTIKTGDYRRKTATNTGPGGAGGLHKRAEP